MKVGDKLWFVPSGTNGGREPYYTEIEKIGRKWVYLTNGYRIEPDTLWADGGQYSTPGRCMASKELHDDEVEATRVLRIVRELIGYGQPRCSAADAHKIALIIGANVMKKDTQS